MAEFSNSKFKTGHDVDLFNRIANEEGFSEYDYQGSIRDYFKAQSNGQFDLDFDVVGVCPLSHNYAYYGEDVNGDDAKADEMVVEACNWAHNNGVDFSKYDWDGDGYVDEVFVLYAGKGQADNSKIPDLI